MASIYRKLKTLFVFPDGEDGWVVKTQSPEGEQLEFELDLERAARLLEGVSRAVADMAKKAAPPKGGGT
jgi:ribosome-associated toxin RatA of RatAB toxin-antitoxin module